jgi:hypothetical protein
MPFKYVGFDVYMYEIRLSTSQNRIFIAWSVQNDAISIVASYRPWFSYLPQLWCQITLTAMLSDHDTHSSAVRSHSQLCCQIMTLTALLSYHTHSYAIRSWHSQLYCQITLTAMLSDHDTHSSTVRSSRSQLCCQINTDSKAKRCARHEECFVVLIAYSLSQASSNVSSAVLWNC